MRRKSGVLWRVPLVIAVVAMLVAAVEAALNYKPVADVIVTGGFAIGVLAVPLWLLTTIFRKEA